MTIFVLMISEIQLEETVSRIFDGIEFKKEPRGLYEPLDYMIGIGGKRVRPKLCLLAYSLFKDEMSDSALNVAAALEVFHTFTLIHDDIMDKSALRRGMPTVWAKWNEDTAILSGDVMLIDSYSRMSCLEEPVYGKAVALFSKTAAEVCEGQQLDMDFENLQQVSMEQYAEMIGLKTAVLLACSAKMGALVAGATEQEAQALYDYGYQLGMAFQVADDYLDAYGDQSVFGKPIGGDIIQNKKSWLITRALEKSADKQEIFNIMKMPVSTKEECDGKIAAMKEVYARLNVDEDAKYEIIRYSGNAIDALKEIHLSRVHMEALHRFSEKLVGRAK